MVFWIITQCWLQVDTDVSRENAASNFRVSILHPLGYLSVSEEEMSWLCLCRFAEVDTFAPFSHFISFPTDISPSHPENRGSTSLRTFEIDMYLYSSDEQIKIEL